MSGIRGDVLAAIQKLTTEKGYAPTVRELGDEVGLSSSSTVHAHLKRLQNAGLIAYEENRPRTVRLVK